MLRVTKFDFTMTNAVFFDHSSNIFCNIPKPNKKFGKIGMDAFGIENLRCLSDTGLIKLKPLTILVGQNSSGKSTFLRALPLLRQSVESLTTCPLLWYGRFLVPTHPRKSFWFQRSCVGTKNNFQITVFQKNNFLPKPARF